MKQEEFEREVKELVEDMAKLTNDELRALTYVLNLEVNKRKELINKIETIPE